MCTLTEKMFCTSDELLESLLICRFHQFKDKIAKLTDLSSAVHPVPQTEAESVLSSIDVLNQKDLFILFIHY